MSKFPSFQKIICQNFRGIHQITRNVVNFIKKVPLAASHSSCIGSYYFFWRFRLVGLMRYVWIIFEFWKGHFLCTVDQRAHLRFAFAFRNSKWPAWVGRRRTDRYDDELDRLYLARVGDDRNFLICEASFLSICVALQCVVTS